MLHTNSKYEILTPTGWKDFLGVTCTENKVLYKIEFANGKSITATESHYFFNNEKKIQLRELSIGDFIDTEDGKIQILNIFQERTDSVYDIVEVGDELHRYLINGEFHTKNCDEMAFLAPNISKEFFTSISPTLATGGKCIITSTPNTDEDQFAEIWFGANRTIDKDGAIKDDVGVNGFRPYLVTWERVPGRDKAWADAERASIGETEFAREHQCEFVTFEETLINPIKLADLKSIEPTHKTGQVRWYGNIDPTMTYVVSLDPSMGTGGDNAAIQVLELPTLKQVAEWCNNKTTIEEQIRILKRILQEIHEQGKPEIYWSVENNSLGEAALVVIRDTGEENFRGTMLHDPKNKMQGTKRRGGFLTTNKSKLEACAKLKSLVESQKLKLNSKAIISELKTFVSRGNTFEAKIGQTDDLIMAMILAIRMVEFISTWEDQTHSAFNSSVGSDDDNEYDAPMPVFI